MKDILPKVLVAGDKAGCLTEKGAALVEGLLPVGTRFAFCIGNAFDSIVSFAAYRFLLKKRKSAF